MGGFADPTTAQEARDVLTRLFIKVLDQERPPYQYGTVTQIDADLGSCLVLLSGDTTPVRVAFGAMRPARTGQVVRVSGSRGDRFISDVVGGAVVADQPTDTLTAPVLTLVSFYESATARWTAVTGAAKYELQVADDAAFTVNLRSFQTVSLEIYLTNLTAGSTIHARVRALTSYGGTGPFSVAQSTVIGSVPGDPSDGVPPAASPQPVITPGIGFLLAEWLPTPNADIVTYEVHISTVSGFTPSAATKVGEVDGTHYFIRRLPGSGVVYTWPSWANAWQGTPGGSGSGGGTLQYGTTYFVRIIAKDADGAAGVSAQGSGSPVKVETSDVGTIPTSAVRDGNAPSNSPTPVVTNGIGYLFANWAHVPNVDPVTYEIHVSVTSGFTPSSNTLVGTTESNFAFIRKQGPGGSPANGALVYGTLYYVKLIAKDADGQAAAGGQASGTPLQALATDIGPNSITTQHILAGSITAASAIIADAAIGTAKIQDAAITTAKIGAAQITTALIGDLQVVTAKIADLAVSNAKIGDLAVTNAKIADLDAIKITAGFLSANRIEARTLTGDKLAINTVLVDQTISSNNFASGLAGWQIRADGSAEFHNVAVRGSYQTNLSGERIQITSVQELIDGYVANYIKFFSPKADGLDPYRPGRLFSDMAAGDIGQLFLRPPYAQSGSGQSGLGLESYNDGTGLATMFSGGLTGTSIVLRSGLIELNTDQGSVTAFGHLKTGGGYHIVAGSQIGAESYGGRGDGTTPGGRPKFHSGSGELLELYWNAGSFHFLVNNSIVKTFIIDHPSKPSTYLVHATLEGPENGVYYRGTAKLIEGTATIKLPDYFEALTNPQGRTVQLTPLLHRQPPKTAGMTLAVTSVPMLAASYPLNGEFTVMAVGGAVVSEVEFCWEVKAIRKDVQPLFVEPKTNQVSVHGEGPYKYYTTP